MAFRPKDAIDKKLIEKYDGCITVNPLLYGITYNNNTNYTCFESCSCNICYDENDEEQSTQNDKINDDTEAQQIIDDSKKSVVEKIKAIKEIQVKIMAENKDSELSEFSKKRIEKIRQSMQVLINPNKMYERLGIDLLQIHVGKNLISLADPDKDGELLFYIAQLRQKLVDDLGYIIPNVRMLDTIGIKPNEYEIYVRGRKVFHAELLEDDINNKNCGKIIEDFKNVCIKYAHQIMTKTDVLKLMELVKSQDPTLVNDLVPLFLSPIDLKKIFANLISQNISIKDIIFVFEILNDHARYTRDVEELTQFLKDELNFVKE